MRRIHAPSKVALNAAVAHHMESAHRRPSGSRETRTDLRQHFIAVVVFHCRVFAEELLEERNHELRLIRVVTVGIGFCVEIIGKMTMLLGSRPLEVARKIGHRAGNVGRTLHVRFAAHGVQAAAGNTDVAEQKLDDRHRTAVLTAVSVLRLTKRIEERTGLAGLARTGVHLPDLHHHVRIHACHLGDHFGRVAVIVALHDVEHAERIFKRHIALENFQFRRHKVRRAGLFHPGVLAGRRRIPLFEAFNIVAPRLSRVAL